MTRGREFSILKILFLKLHFQRSIIGKIQAIKSDTTLHFSHHRVIFDDKFQKSVCRNSFPYSLAFVRLDMGIDI